MIITFVYAKYNESYKNNSLHFYVCKEFVLAGVEGFEPSPVVLETIMLAVNTIPLKVTILY